MGGDRQPRERLVGSYNPDQRRRNVLGGLEAAFDAIRKMDIRKMVEDEMASGRKQGDRPKNGECDVVTMQLNSLKFQINELKIEVGGYRGPHFTKKYRTLQGDCAKLQVALDSLVVSARDNLRKERKAALMEVEGCTKQLKTRAHSNGRSCDSCEVPDRL